MKKTADKYLDGTAAVELPTALQPDEFVPDTIVAKEFNRSLMGLYRWTNDPNLGFPPPIKIRTKNFRSRRAIEEFKERMMQRAIAERSKKRAEVA